MAFPIIIHTNKELEREIKDFTIKDIEPEVKTDSVPKKTRKKKD